MADRQTVLEEKRHVSSKVSDLCRYIGFGVVAVAWATLNSSANFAVELTSNFQTELTISAVLGLLTVGLDYLQFVAGYLAVNRALQSENNEYDSASLSYKLRVWSFWVKQATAAGAIVALLYVVFRSLS